jgi:ubiquinone/menaquinone biosynthesis C-methylase UbiE
MEPSFCFHAGRGPGRRLLVGLFMVAALLGPGPACAQLEPPMYPASAVAAPGYTTTRPSPDGIGKRYLGREIAGVMGWQGAAWLEREEREREERTDLLMKALALTPGLVVADVGAGTGYLARRMAKAVAPGGKVLAVDVQPEMIKMLQALATKDGLANIVPSLGAEEDVRLPAGTVDLAIMVDVYHELAYPREVLTSIVKALKPGGRVVFIEYRAEDPQVPIKALHKMSQVQVKREVAALPAAQALVWERTVDSLPWQHMMVFRKPQ